MKDVILVISVLYIGITLGTFIKFSDYGFKKRFTAILTLATPFLVILGQFKTISKHIQNKKYKRAISQFFFTFTGYPLLIRAIGEIATESIAKSIALQNIQQKKQEEVFHKVKKQNIKEKLFEDISIYNTILKNFKKMLNNKKMHISDPFGNY